MDFFVSMGVSLVLAALKEFVKNPAKKVEMKKAMLKVYNGIKATYADDPDFQ